MFSLTAFIFSAFIGFIWWSSQNPEHPQSQIRKNWICGGLCVGSLVGSNYGVNGIAGTFPLAIVLGIHGLLFAEIQVNLKKLEEIEVPSTAWYRTQQVVLTLGGVLLGGTLGNEIGIVGWFGGINGSIVTALSFGVMGFSLAIGNHLRAATKAHLEGPNQEESTLSSLTLFVGRGLFALFLLSVVGYIAIIGFIARESSRSKPPPVLVESQGQENLKNYQEYSTQQQSALIESGRSYQYSPPQPERRVEPVARSAQRRTYSTPGTSSQIQIVGSNDTQTIPRSRVFEVPKQTGPNVITSGDCSVQKANLEELKSNIKSSKEANEYWAKQKKYESKCR